MSLKIIKAGIADTIQDMGRYGWQHLGINPTGAMDRFAAQLANTLTGNEPGAAVIEMHFPSSVYLFQQPALLAVTGADFSATINGEPISLLQPVVVNKNSVLQFQEPKQGARAYLSVNGGFDIPKWLNSYSTNLKANTGGYYGRALNKDDELPIHSFHDLSNIIAGKEKYMLPWKADTDWGDPFPNEILFLPGNEWNWLTEESKLDFENQDFIITPNSDRMGYRLSAGILIPKVNDELVSSVVCFGTVQLLPDGRLILLMADHQTTGGYPRIAHVITAHHSKLAQMKPGDTINFRMTDLETATSILMKQQQHLNLLKNASQLKLKEFLDASKERNNDH